MNETVEIANQVTQNAPLAEPQGSMWGMIIYCIIIMAILYLFMIRPGKKRMAEYQKMLDITIRIISSPPFILFAVILIVSYALTGRKKKKSS